MRKPNIRIISRLYQEPANEKQPAIALCDFRIQGGACSYLARTAAGAAAAAAAVPRAAAVPHAAAADGPSPGAFVRFAARFVAAGLLAPLAA